jgi:hypothetical protein
MIAASAPGERIGWNPLPNPRQFSGSPSSRLDQRMTHPSPTLSLFAQRSNKSISKPAQRAQTSKQGLDSEVYYLGGAAAILVACAVFWFARKRWIKLRPTLAARPGAVAERERPGLLAENLAQERWEKSVGITLKGVEAALLTDGSAIAAKAATALREVTPLPPTLAAITQQAAATAIESGELQTRLIATKPTAVFTLVCPARHAHVRLLRKHPAFADGWLEYAAQLRRGLAENGSQTDVLFLLFFLGPDARDGTLAVAFEADDGRLATAELLDGEGPSAKPEGFTSGADRPLRRVSGWSFHLAAPADERAAS